MHSHDTEKRHRTHETSQTEELEEHEHPHRDKQDDQPHDRAQVDRAPSDASHRQQTAEDREIGLSRRVAHLMDAREDPTGSLGKPREHGPGDDQPRLDGER